MSNEITWEQPPPRGSAATDRYDALTAALVARPHEWARVPDSLYVNANTTATTIRAGGVQAFSPRGSYEAAVRKGVLYARYVGTAAPIRNVA